MTQAISDSHPDDPLNDKQLAFARYVGIARARGCTDKDLVAAYERAGYKPDRGNARRLAADPRVKKFAEEACAHELEVLGLHIQELQGMALELLRASPTKIHREISRFIEGEIVHSGSGQGGFTVRYKLRDDLTEAEAAQLDAATWASQEFKIDKDGIVTIKLPDKKAIIEMLAKQLGVGLDKTQVNVGLSLEALIAQSMEIKKSAEAAV